MKSDKKSNSPLSIAAPTFERDEVPLLVASLTENEDEAPLPIAAPTADGDEAALPIAAPSWVLPGTMAANALFLAGKVEEVGLCCFESSSAAMPEDELPRSLAALPLRWHVHLPVDIDPCSGAKAAEACLRVWERAAFLSPRFGVLHLPEYKAGQGPDSASQAAAWAHDFFAAWTRAGLSLSELALENTLGSEPWSYPGVDKGLDLSLCLDVAHMLAYGQTGVLALPEWLAAVHLAHWSAPGPPFSANGTNGGHPDRHLPLTAWTPEQRALAAVAARSLPPGVTHLVEVFQWEGVRQSWPELRALLAPLRG